MPYKAQICSQNYQRASLCDSTDNHWPYSTAEILEKNHIVLLYIQVNQTVGEVESVNVTMSGVFSGPSLAVAEVSPNDKQCCPRYAIDAIALCLSCCNQLYFFPESLYK